jgi:cbb3-type cytochrome oxidase maturation protein
MEWLIYALVSLVAAALTGSAVYALYWSSRNGQLRDFQRGAISIFDEEEPVGQMTDRFPPKRTKPRAAAPEAAEGKP